MRKLRVLDLFSGIGGWTLGLHRAGYETVAACEIDEWKRAQYQRLWPNVRVYTDVTRLAGADVVNECGPIDLIAGSPPCKHISSASAGDKRGVDGDGLFFEAVRLVNEIRPDWCAFENSPHLRTRGADRVLSVLEEIGYACWPLVVGACNAGAAHKRQRVWIVGRFAAGEQGRIARQSRQSKLLGADTNGVKQVRIRGGRNEPGAISLDLGRHDLSSHSDGQPVRIAELPGRAVEETPVSTDDSSRLGPVGAANLSSSIRAYDGVSGRDAERARHAYGDAIVPQIATALGRAILQAEAAA